MTADGAGWQVGTGRWAGGESVAPVRRSLGGGAARARAGARQRHPSARGWAPDRTRLLVRLADRAQAQGAPWPRVAAAVLFLRGVTGDDRAAFARRVGLSEPELDHIERGRAPASAVPSRLRSVPGLVDWAWVEGTEPEADLPAVDRAHDPDHDR